MQHYIQFENVTKSYGEGNTLVTALSNINFSIDEGEFCVLLGAFGPGKTTLLNLLGSMDSASSGKIHFITQQAAFNNIRRMTDRAEAISFPEKTRFQVFVPDFVPFFKIGF